MTSSIAKQRDLQSHLDTVKARIESQGLSVLELQDMANAKASELTTDITTEHRERIMAEHQLISGMAMDAQAPDPEPAEMAEIYREQGRHDLAEVIEHGLVAEQQINQRNEIANQLAELQAKPNPDALEQRKIDKLTQQLENADPLPVAPHVKRQQEAVEKRATAKKLRTEAQALFDSGQSGELDLAAAEKQASTLEGEATFLASPASAAPEGSAA